MSLAPRCLWFLNVSGSSSLWFLMSLVPRRLWFLDVPGSSMSLDPRCPWLLDVCDSLLWLVANYGFFMSIASWCLRRLSMSLPTSYQFKLLLYSPLSIKTILLIVFPHVFFLQYSFNKALFVADLDYRMLPYSTPLTIESLLNTPSIRPFSQLLLNEPFAIIIFVFPLHFI